MSAIDKLFSTDVRLPSAPAVAVRILEIVKRDQSSFKQLSSVIGADPALAAKILRLVNSGFYSRPRKITSIDTAVAILGGNAVKNLALSFVLAASFKSVWGERFEIGRFWRRSITCAVACEMLRKATNSRQDELFITGLLADIGVMAMYTAKPDTYLRVMDEKLISGRPVSRIEKQLFGFDHQEIGADLLDTWGLPESIHAPVRFHHDVDRAPKAWRPACLTLQAADRISAIYHGVGGAKTLADARRLLATNFALGEEQISLLIDGVAESSTEVISQFEFDGASIKPLSKILEEANSELAELNISYEMLLVEYRNAKERAERLSGELARANEKLHELAFRDGLTGLYNHRYLHEALHRELAECLRYHRPLSLIMLDVDHFKSINDKYGHPYGDAVIACVAREIETRARKSDLVARYGGDEIAIILPQTPPASAMVAAEAHRAGVDGAIRMGTDHTPVTISVGVASVDPAVPISVEELIRAADAALYKAKQAGRNRVALNSQEDITGGYQTDN